MIRYLRGGLRHAFRFGPLVLAVALVTPPLGAQTSERVEAARKGAVYLASVQNNDGSFPHADGAHRAAEGVWAISATGMGGAPIERALDYIENTGVDEEDAGQVGMVILGLVAAGEEPRSFRGTDYVAMLTDTYEPATGKFEAPNFFSSLLGALGHVAAGETLPDEALNYIDANECDGGGFGFLEDCEGFEPGVPGTDVDTTAYALNLFVAAQRDQSNPVAQRARDYLLGAQNPDGGFPFSPGFDTSADSTGTALTALAALGENDAAAVAALMDLQEDSGAFRRDANETDTNDWSTVNALAGLAGSSLPVQPAENPIPIEDTPGATPTPSPAPTSTPGPGSSSQATVQGTVGTPGPELPDTGPSEPASNSAGAVVALLAAAVLVSTGLRASRRS